ncbi:hybrid sensor histidine kinase/response regulator [Mesorhizobium sp. M1C.F.Ca.ET.193.01.1.1]|uniref:hybrid sensor histidine kinase/response regulator n=1 Tax=unclassified Mesorhizobium TaxID=325217 RepID=UPI000FD1A8F3|nr:MULTISPECIES: hybrid sensor histidine kinase/response regulator [unclassified Mesorhizobium]TGT01419.1 hybrid sensor histidine kinase/response regulator [bacterium M00.F.Ca.ET.177.01.1.1]TGQ54178.1 hybrid sensor histidine kinase/response regulator [Mesorhizobium sp. M1C.F.Ca.ET.210.01.1.1]TGQ72191.1 hybrid sensor histidine kinase/response regulator [Mesorhizobium sp. M1C.F.Ca.ET.212.01.1.1]TGR10007.1 hybrid sensor histidine kinase/response regulator [Mesorhizobium sp. M1C.F.Ca.ET.204.01.1.1]
MPLQKIDDIEKLKKINAALVSRVERSMDQQGNAFSLFQTAISLENRVRTRTEELHATLRRLEQSNVDLVAAKETAELANLSKTRFLAAASHDVLQPLNAAHLSVSALAEVQTSDEGRKLVRQVERSLETMEDLLRTLLDISKLDAGVVQPEIGDVSLEALFSSLRSDFLPEAEKKCLSLKFRPVNVVVRSDRTLLRRILQNILSNALRYTRSGGVLVGTRHRGDTIRIDVADTGCGIPDDQREAVFEEFHRGTSTLTDAGLAGGLGLGLAIVRRMAAALGHPVTFSSKVGRGTIFHIDVPVGMLQATEQATGAGDMERPRGYGLFGTKVLLVENDADVLSAMTSLLERWQCLVRAATSTDDALDLIGDTAWVPDIIIADQHLDGGDLGTATIAEVRDYLGRPVPALIVTADGSELVAKAARAAGIELMRKPLKPAQLRALLAHLLA